MATGSSPPDLDYIASLLDQHDPSGKATTTAVSTDENRSPPNLILTPTSWKSDHWLKPPPDLPSYCRLDPPSLSSAEPPSREPLNDDHHKWRSSRQMVGSGTARAPDLPPPPASSTTLTSLLPPTGRGRADSPEVVHLQRQVQELQQQLQTTVATRADLEHALETSRSREQATLDDLSKCNETVRELRRINQKLTEERALYEAKISAQLRKDERIRNRLETELGRQKDLVRDITDEAARLRAALQEAATETDLCVQREKENWARAETLRNEQLIQRLQQEAAAAGSHPPGDGSLRERDLQLAQLNLQLSEQQQLLEQQQRDNERLVDQATKLQALLDQYNQQQPGTSSETSLLLELKEIQARTRSDVSESVQAVLQERDQVRTEFRDLKQQLRLIADQVGSVDQRLERQTDAQANIQKQIMELETRFLSMPADTGATPQPVGAAPSICEPVSDSAPDPADRLTRETLARHLQRAAELGVDLPPHMPRFHPPQPHQQQQQQQRQLQAPTRSAGNHRSHDPQPAGRPSISSTRTRPIRKAAVTAKKSGRRTSQTRSPVRSRLYPAPPTSWR